MESTIYRRCRRVEAPYAKPYAEPYVEPSIVEPSIVEPYAEPPLAAKPLFTIAQSTIIIYPPKIGLKKQRSLLY